MDGQGNLFAPEGGPEAPAGDVGHAPKAGREPHAEAKATALISLGNATLGIPVLNLREVMMHPPELHPLLSGGPYALGCVSLRGQVIPVLDITAALNLPAAPQAPEIIAILRDAGRLVGICAHAVRRIVPAKDLALQDLTPAGGPFTLQVLPKVALAGSDVISMVDAGALLDAPDVPHTVEAQTRSRQMDRSGQYLLCQIGDWRYCVSVSQIEATLAETPVDSSVLYQGACEGAILRHGIEMALLNPHVYAGFSTGGDRPAQSAGIVLRLDAERCLTLRTDRISDILHLQRSQITPVPKALCSRPDLFQGVIFVAGGKPCFVLDIERLLAEAEVQSLAAIAHRSRDNQVSPQSTGDGPKGVPGTAILVRAGGLRALPIHEVEEIVPNPPMFKGSDRRHDGYVDSIAYRGGLLPIFCMTWLAGITVAELGERSGIVVVKEAGERIGLLVQDIVSIEHVRFVEDVPDTPGGPMTRLALRNGTTTQRLVAVWPLTPAPAEMPLPLEGQGAA